MGKALAQAFRPRVCFAALAVAVLALMLPASSAAAPAWLAPQDLSVPGHDSYAPQAALDPAGNAVAVWLHSDGTNVIVQAAVRPGGGAWGAPQDLSTAGQDALKPQVALDAAGNALAVWIRSNGTNYIVQAAARPAGGAWSAPQDLSAAGHDADFPQVALDAAGNGLAVWEGDNGTNEIVQAAARPAGGAWSAPQDLSATGQNAHRPQVALDPAGNALAVWERSNGTNLIVQAAARPAGGAWSAPQDLSAAGHDADLPQVALDAAGNGLAVWERDNGTTEIVQAAARPTGGAWSAPQDLSAGQNAANPQVALDADGNALAVWEHYNGTNYIVQAAARPAVSGVWQTPQDLSAAGQSAYEPEVALAAAGNALAVWIRSNGTNDIVQAAARPPASGVWQAPQDLSAAGRDAANPQVTLDAAGDALAVWQRYNGANAIVEGAGYDYAGPVFHGLSIPTSGTPGTALVFSVSPFDVWSALAGQPHWTFGDGSSADGTNVSHTYAAAGTYSVGLSQSDVLGNQSSTSRNVSIAAPPPPPPPPPSPPPPPPTCLVPKVVGKTLAKAKAAIKSRHCRTGKVTRVYSTSVKQGRVVSQRPKAGRRLANRARVSLVVSRGRRR